MSSRFSASIGRECLKCLYYEHSVEESMLFRMLTRERKFDKYIIVGGYRFDDLCDFIDLHFSKLRDQIILLKNDHFNELGSGYSFFIGLQEAVKFKFDELIFAEGDLYIDNKSFNELYDIKSNVITFTFEPITAQKSVIFYFNKYWEINYIYDTAHGCLEIHEPFVSIYNSGQVWKFVDYHKVRILLQELSADQWFGTNLIPIQQYFGQLTTDEYNIFPILNWVNCNTVEDFKSIQKGEYYAEHK